MTREQAKQKLISYGVAEPTDEQITDLLNSINAETKKEKDRADGYKAKAEEADALQLQLDEISSKGLTEVEKLKNDLEKSNKRVAELEKTDLIRSQRSKAMEQFKINAEQAGKVIKDDGSFDYEILGQIISEKEKNAVAEFEKQALHNTPNPNGGNGGNADTKTTAEKLVESIYGGQKQDNNILSHYVGGN